mmetsp:Transcript_29327/g.60992  ORF Transcript_29327/g.60992 Transcript_29327/m.60992 type:complete len:347 (-) Transcript_29327:589-1629(-)
MLPRNRPKQHVPSDHRAVWHRSRADANLVHSIPFHTVPIQHFRARFPATMLCRSLVLLCCCSHAHPRTRSLTHLVEVLGDVPPPRPVPGNDDRVPGTKVVARPVFVRQAPKTVQEVKDRGRRGVVRRVLVRPPAPGPGGGPAGNRCSGLREHQELVVRVAGGEVLGARDRIAGVGGSRRPPARDQLLGQDVLPGGQEQWRARGFCCRGNAAGPGALSEGRGCDDDDDVVVVAAHATAPRCPGNDSGNDPRRDEGAARAAGGMAPAEALFHRGGGEFLEGIEAREVLVPAEGGELPQRWRRGVWLVAMARLVVPGRLPPRTCDRRRSKGGRTAHRKGAGLRRPGEDR